MFEAGHVLAVTVQLLQAVIHDFGPLGGCDPRFGGQSKDNEDQERGCFREERVHGMALRCWRTSSPAESGFSRKRIGRAVKKGDRATLRGIADGGSATGRRCAGRSLSWRQNWADRPSV